VKFNLDGEDERAGSVAVNATAEISVRLGLVPLLWGAL
jgi:hypothetical protein